MVITYTLEYHYYIYCDDDTDIKVSSVAGLPLTARQKREVALPDVSIGQSRVLGISPETVPVQGGYGALFASHGTYFLAFTGVAVQC